MQKVLPLMPDGASIILNASIVASKGSSSNSVCCTTKADALLRTHSRECGKPRLYRHASAKRSAGFGEAEQERLKIISNTVPFGRLGRPDEIAKAEVFLASDDSSYIRGMELFVDGGFAQV